MILENCVISLLRFICFMISNFGYYNMIRKYTKLDVSFIPLITIGIQVTLLFFAGILNILLMASAAMLASGIILFMFDMIHNEKKSYRQFADVSYAFMGICMIVLFACLYGRNFIYFDDFSHWASAVQEMMSSNRYPNNESWIIYFKTYPLGSSTYIYYCCLLAGTEEGIQMLAQAFMMICAIMPLFSCIKKHRISALIYLVVFTNFVLVYNTPLSSLVVDTLLPLFGMGTFLIIWNIFEMECTQGKKTEKSNIWVAAPLMIMIMMIKNSGFFFALPSMVLTAVLWQKASHGKIYYAGVTLAPVAAMFLWKRHCEYVFLNSEFSKHTVSFQNYLKQYADKSTEDIWNIGYGILNYIISHPALICLLLMLLIIFATQYLFHRDQIKKLLKFSGLILGMYLLYILGLYCMFIFSMPIYEAQRLMGIERYVGTIDIASFYILTAYLLKLLDGEIFKKKFIVAFTGVFTALIMIWGVLTHWDVIPDEKNTQPRQWIMEQIEKYDVPWGASCAICTSNENANEYLSYMLRYILWSPSIYQRTGFNEDNLDLLNNYQYLIMFDYNNEAVNQWIQENHPEQYGNSIIAIS